MPDGFSWCGIYSTDTKIDGPEGYKYFLDSICGEISKRSAKETNPEKILVLSLNLLHESGA
jgi:hypothetical protein